MTTKEKIITMQAYEDGKIIEFKPNWYETIWTKITDKSKEPLWNWDNYTYRISPEHTEPFKQEFIISKDMKNYWNKWSDIMISCHEAESLKKFKVTIEEIS